MSRAFLRAGAELIVEGEPYVMERQCADGMWVLRHLHTDRQLERTTDEVLDGYVAGTTIFKVKVLRHISSLTRRMPDPVNMSPQEIEAAKIRMQYVRAVKGLPFTKRRIEAAIESVWQSLEPRPARPPGWVSVYRWARSYANSCASPGVLVVSHRSKGNRRRRFSQEVIELCEEVIDDYYLQPERPSVLDTVNLAKAKARRTNQLQPSSAQVAMPSLCLIRRLIAQIPAFDKHVARYGRDAARNKFRGALHHRVTDYPLHRAEMDHTRMDLLVVDDVRFLPLGRPWLTLLVDDYSRCVLGFCLSFEPPSRATVARCLRHAFMPKIGLRATYPDMKNEWLAFGVMSELVMDGGPEFYSTDIDQICFDLDIEQHYSPRKTPWFKGKVERLNATVNRGVTVIAPGKTFGGILERNEYNPAEHAVVTMSTLLRIVHRWIVDVYHQKRHSALGCSPDQMWKTSVGPHDIGLIDSPLRFDAVLGGSDSRVLTHKGIEYGGLFYNSNELVNLRQLLGDRLSVDIRIDRSNIGALIVLHPERNTPYRVPCTTPEYAEGLTEWQHNLCKHYAREKQWSDDPEAWLDSLLEITEIVEEAITSGKRKGTARARVARWSQSKAPSLTNSDHPRRTVAKGATLPSPPTPSPSPTSTPSVTPVPIHEPRAATLPGDAQAVVPQRFIPQFVDREPSCAPPPSGQGE